MRKYFLSKISKDLWFWVGKKSRSLRKCHQYFVLRSRYQVVQIPWNASGWSVLWKTYWYLECWVYHCWAVNWRAYFSWKLHSQSVVKDHWVYWNSIEIECWFTQKLMCLKHFEQLKRTQETSQGIFQKMRQGKFITHQALHQNARIQSKQASNDRRALRRTNFFWISSAKR